jgi:hypothetical protein
MAGAGENRFAHDNRIRASRQTVYGGIQRQSGQPMSLQNGSSYFLRQQTVSLKSAWFRLVQTTSETDK